MKTYSQFFNTELFKKLCEYAKQGIYRKTEDNIYNFKGATIQGELKEEINRYSGNTV